MAKKKGKKKSSSNAGRKGTIKSDASEAAVPGDCGGDISGPPPKTLNDVSSLLFDNKKGKLPFSLPFIGPILLAERHEDNIVSHGRGLIATRDISPGECLFVIPSTVSVDAAEVRKRYLQGNIGGDEANLEKITEDLLVETVQYLCGILDDEEIQPKENVDCARRLLGAFTAQMSSEELPKREDSHEWMDILLANDSSPIGNKDYSNLDEDIILGIVRKNAFGPDYHNYDKIRECWTKRANIASCYNRLLGAYPLSAMINHSCSPNSLRVFGSIPPPLTSKETASSEIEKVQGREVMIVHANAHIPKGSEITWSYLPPSTPFVARREMLRTRHKFICQCKRCLNENIALNTPSVQKEQWALADDYWSLRNANGIKQEASTMITLVPSLEQIFSTTKQLTLETQQYLRVGYSTLYMDFLNATLNLDKDESITQILKMATQLHFSFESCNNASTEHLSIIHFLFDLSNLLHNRAVKRSNPGATGKTMIQVRFWTNQLKRAHMVRYGDLGEDLENVRDAMKHSKLVLRNPEGWYLAKNRFI